MTVEYGMCARADACTRSAGTEGRCHPPNSTMQVRAHCLKFNCLAMRVCAHIPYMCMHKQMCACIHPAGAEEKCRPRSPAMPVRMQCWQGLAGLCIAIGARPLLWRSNWKNLNRCTGFRFSQRKGDNDASVVFCEEWVNVAYGRLLRRGTGFGSGHCCTCVFVGQVYQTVKKVQVCLVYLNICRTGVSDCYKASKCAWFTLIFVGQVYQTLESFQVCLVYLNICRTGVPDS